MIYVCTYVYMCAPQDACLCPSEPQVSLYMWGEARVLLHVPGALALCLVGLPVPALRLLVRAQLWGISFAAWIVGSDGLSSLGSVSLPSIFSQGGFLKDDLCVVDFPVCCL